MKNEYAHTAYYPVPFHTQLTHKSDPYNCPTKLIHPRNSPTPLRNITPPKEITLLAPNALEMKRVSPLDSFGAFPDLQNLQLCEDQILLGIQPSSSHRPHSGQTNHNTPHASRYHGE